MKLESPRFNRSNGHDANKWYALRDDIEALIRKRQIVPICQEGARSRRAKKVPVPSKGKNSNQEGLNPTEANESLKKKAYYMGEYSLTIALNRYKLYVVII